MRIERQAQDTLTAIEMDLGDELHFTLASGAVRRLKLIHAGAAVTETTVETPKVEKAGAVTNYRFSARFEIDGAVYNLVRYVSSAKSFYEPWHIMGMHIWLDAVDKIFDFLTETHGECKPKKQCRLAIQDATLRICPVLLHPWCPLPPDRLRVEDAYNGEDVWMGAYHGASAHGGLDINHPSGTPIWTPFAIDDHELFNSLAKGDNNNRWRGTHRWSNGAEWVIQVHHLSRLYVPEHKPIEAGTLLADGGGVWVGSHEHSHFVFRVRDGGGEVLLDPWILFWQMYRDRTITSTA
ncbi:MAG: hypothetical protein HS116_28170 [Planctomycetes bacterium]|nr:hypothetical protein [Planctomycetota bacterium]